MGLLSYGAQLPHLYLVWDLDSHLDSEQSPLKDESLLY